MKEKELDVLEKLIEGEIEDKDKKRVVNKLFISQIIVAVILLILLIISLANIRRSILFSYLVFNNTAIIPVFLYSTLSIGFCYTVGVIMVYLIGKNDLNIIRKLAKIYQKIDLVRFIDLILSAGFFVIVFIFTPCNVIGDSMNDTLKNGDRVVTTDLFYSTPKKGDIVTFDCSNYVNSNSTLFIKRVVATKDSYIEYDSTNLTLSVDGEVCVYDIDTKEYARIYLTANDIYKVSDLTSAILYQEYEKSFTMPKGKALVFGDNRNNSRDSEEFGAISTKDIFGHVLFRFGKGIETNIIY